MTYSLITLGFLCTVINLELNGLGILLPTCFGYVFIAAGAGSLQSKQRIFKWTIYPAALMAIVTFPDLFRGVIQGEFEAFHGWTFWPTFAIETALKIMLAIGLWQEANYQNSRIIKNLAGGTAMVFAIFLPLWKFFPVKDNATLIASFLVYEIPSFYLAFVFYLASKKMK